MQAHLLSLLFSLIISYLSLPAAAAAAATTIAAQSPPLNSSVQSDAVSILAFKSKADLNNKLLYELNERFDYCQWQGVKCAQGRVVRFVLPGFGLRGIFASDTLTRLDQLRVLSLQNNSLAGPIPDLSGLANLKSLFLDRNSFSGSLPPSVFTLHRLRTLDLSYNNLSGPIPVELNDLDRLIDLRLQWNRFNGTVPPLNQSELKVFNVSRNNLTGAIPVTPTLSRFDISSFSWNPNLCGEIIHKDCFSPSPFFDSAVPAPPPGPHFQNTESQGVIIPPPSPTKHKKTGMILGFTIGIVVLIGSLLCFFALLRKQSNRGNPKAAMALSDTASVEAAVPEIAVVRVREEELEPKVKKVQGAEGVRKSGKLVFCTGEAEAYSLEQLMRASAEMLGRGTIGTTYKAVLDNQLIVSVKRLDAIKTAIITGDMFERHMDSVGGLRHPNLVPVRAYFQAKEERLIIFEYQPNGSLFNLVHGSRSSRAKPLHWTSCLKIAEDVAQGLAYIHQASRLVHGNLKSTNVLLGADFEACLTDYCLAVLADTSSNDDPDSAGYKAPETRKSSRRATPKSDVYAFGILLLELLTGKHPSQHPFLMPPDMPDWVRAMREDDGGEDDRLGMLIEVASVCCLTSPEQRPAMWQVLKMIQEIKESAMMEDNMVNASVGFS